MGAEHEEWESYPCRVDDEPASILLNLAYRDQRPPDHDTLYCAGLEILEPGDHGMGLEPDVEELWRLEDQISGAATAKGFTYVGRVRSQGDWQLALYAPLRKGRRTRIARRRGARRERPWLSRRQ